MSALLKAALLTLFVFWGLISPTSASAALLDVDKGNWDSFNQATFNFLTISNGISCFGSGWPLGGQACPVVAYIKDNTQKWLPHIKLADSGEGGGVLQASTRMMAMMYLNQPASGVSYLAQTIQNGIHFVQPAYAQIPGTGASVIQPVQSLWLVSRNVAYIVFILIFLVIGFMIMLRSKINPQTVVNAQQALPGVIIALILVTFSYFIAGLIIDIAFFGSQLIGILLISNLSHVNAAAANTRVLSLLNGENVTTMFYHLAINGDLMAQAGDTIKQIALDATRVNDRVLTGLAGVIAGCFNPVAGVLVAASLPLGVAACAGVGGLTGVIAGPLIVSTLIYLVFLIVLIWAMFRLLFALIGTYINIIINTILGPFILLFSAIPGNGKVIGYWIRSLLANVLIFPAVFALFLLTAAIMGYGGMWAMENTIPPIQQALPLFGGFQLGFLNIVLAYGLLMISPAIPDLIRKLFGVPSEALITRATEAGIATGASAGMLLGGQISGLGRVGYRFGSRQVPTTWGGLWPQVRKALRQAGTPPRRRP